MFVGLCLVVQDISLCPPGQDLTVFPVEKEVVKALKRHVDLATSIDSQQHRCVCVCVCPCPCVLYPSLEKH